MDAFYFDASALAKRYIPETGTAVVNLLFNAVPRPQLMCLTIGAAEVVSILVRRRNGGQIPQPVFSQGLLNLHAEVILHPEFALLEADDPTVIDSIKFIMQYSINSTDAIVLASALQLNDEFQQRGNPLILVSSDIRLNRAAQAET